MPTLCPSCPSWPNIQTKIISLTSQCPRYHPLQPSGSESAPRASSNRSGSRTASSIARTGTRIRTAWTRSRETSPTSKPPCMHSPSTSSLKSPFRRPRIQALPGQVAKNLGLFGRVRGHSMIVPQRRPPIFFWARILDREIKHSSRRLGLRGPLHLQRTRDYGHLYHV